MKNNNSTICGDLLSSQYGAYASHLNRAVTAINLDFVSYQNEPDFCPNPGYESSNPTPAEIETWMANNAPTVGKPIVMPEAVNFNDSYSDPTLNNSTAASHVTYVAGHFYGGGNTVQQNALNHGKHVWETEHYINGTDIGTAMTVAKEVSDAMNNQFSAYFWWWIMPNDAASFIEGTTVDLRGYMLGQFAHWVRPGKVRCSTTYNPHSNIYVTAYHNNGVAVVALNTGTSAVNQTFTFQNASGITTHDAISDQLQPAHGAAERRDGFQQYVHVFTACAKRHNLRAVPVTILKGYPILKSRSLRFRVGFSINPHHKSVIPSERDFCAKSRDLVFRDG